MAEVPFQSYLDRGNRAAAGAHLPRLREHLRANGLHGVLVPHEDEWLNEYVPPAHDRLAWLTGYSGTFGYAIVTLDAAMLFVDGRYRVQAGEQVDPAFIAVGDVYEDDAARWVAAQVRDGQRIGYDPRLHAPDALAALRRLFDRAGAQLVALADNPVDAIWAECPPRGRSPVRPHELRHAGEASAAKRLRLGQAIASQGAQAAVITSPASVAWLFNVRGRDVRHSPLPLAEAVLRADGSAELFLQPACVDDALLRWLGPQVRVQPAEAFDAALRGLGGQAVLADPQTASAHVFDLLQQHGACVIRGADPVALPRALKNATEIDGARLAHRIDGLAVTKLLHWLDANAQHGTVDEITVAQQLEAFRRQSPALQDLSCGAIAGAGPHGALPHYRVSTRSNRLLERDSLFLIDSGGQYLEGTTDVTRTVAIGQPTAEMRRRYTDVLKGHLRITALRFPPGITGAHIDALSRLELWAAGLDFDHGTGHGVGSYLPIHEGPHAISRRRYTAEPLAAGMLVTNEPGYYKVGHFGIRIENVLLVTGPAAIDGGDRPMLGFETLTLAPYCRDLIELQRLDDDERGLVDRYHARVRDTHAAALEPAARRWLDAATAPL